MYVTQQPVDSTGIIGPLLPLIIAAISLVVGIAELWIRFLKGPDIKIQPIRARSKAVSSGRTIEIEFYTMLSNHGSRGGVIRSWRGKVVNPGVSEERQAISVGGLTMPHFVSKGDIESMITFHFEPGLVEGSPLCVSLVYEVQKRNGFRTKKALFKE